jgi:hypothetical protein
MDKPGGPDAPTAIAAAIVIGALSPSILTMMPVVVQAFVERAGLTEAQGGLIASIEVLGILASTIGFSFLQGRLRWSRAAMAGLGIFACANLASAALSGFVALAIIRFAAGLGAGMSIGAGFVALAITRHPDRWFGWMIAAVLSYAGLGLWFVPIIYRAGGLSALMCGFAAVGLLAMVAAAFIADGRPVQGRFGGPQSAPPLVLRVSALLTLFLFFLGYGIIWTYMTLVGDASGLTEQQSSIALTASQLFGIIGAIAVAVAAEPIERRIGRRGALAIIISLGTAGTACFSLHQSFVLFCALNGLFQFTWNAGQPALLGAVAAADQSGRLVTAAVPMQFLGYTVGPAIASLLVKGGISPVIWVSAGFIAVSFVALLPLTAQRKTVLF